MIVLSRACRRENSHVLLNLRRFDEAHLKNAIQDLLKSRVWCPSSHLKSPHVSSHKLSSSEWMAKQHFTIQAVKFRSGSVLWQVELVPRRNWQVLCGWVLVQSYQLAIFLWRTRKKKTPMLQYGKETVSYGELNLFQATFGPIQIHRAIGSSCWISTLADSSPTSLGSRSFLQGFRSRIEARDKAAKRQVVCAATTQWFWLSQL